MKQYLYIKLVLLSCQTLTQFEIAKQWALRVIPIKYNNQRFQEYLDRLESSIIDREIEVLNRR